MSLKTPKRFFITATDTGVGKTLITQILVTNLQKNGFKVIACKPIACGHDADGLNEDVRVYQTINSLPLPLELINPINLTLPASPNIAAQQEQLAIEIDALQLKLDSLTTLDTDYIFYEGAGGWKVPLNERHTLADLVCNMQVSVILVVGIRVGCLNHALLTWQALTHDQVEVVGWVANIIDPTTPAISEHINTLKDHLKTHFLGTLPHGCRDELLESQHLDQTILL